MKSKALDERSDVYSLAIVASEMVIGRVPFQADTQWGFVNKHVNESPPRMKDVPEQVERVVMKALEKDRDQRYATAPEFARASLRRRPRSSQRAEAIRFCKRGNHRHGFSSLVHPVTLKGVHCQ